MTEVLKRIVLGGFVLAATLQSGFAQDDGEPELLTQAQVDQIRPAIAPARAKANRAVEIAQAEGRGDTENPVVVLVEGIRASVEAVDAAAKVESELATLQASALQLEGAVNTAPDILPRLGASKRVISAVQALRADAARIKELAEAEAPSIGLDPHSLARAMQLTGDLVLRAERAHADAKKLADMNRTTMSRYFAVEAAFRGVLERTQRLERELRGTVVDAAAIRRALRKLKNAQEEAVTPVRWAGYGEKQLRDMMARRKEIGALLK